jgi:HD-GYP domain-containing protein (c-di-GMP phosphodiesterase class II)
MSCPPRAMGITRSAQPAAKEDVMPFWPRGRDEKAALLSHQADLAGEDPSVRVDLTDEELKGAMRHIVELTVRVSRAMGMSEAEVKNARLGALLHDIGMTSVPDDILFKSAPLTEQEWQAVREHPTYAYELLSQTPALAEAVDIPYCHHEKWDGTGYPRGLKGEQIPLSARIFTVVDVWCALQSERPYRKTWTAEEAEEYLLHRAARDFDPKVVEVFLGLLSSE